jgi:hypothetical protein
MSVNKNVAIVTLALLWSALGVSTAVAANPVSNADQLVAQHLDSIASAQVRAGLKSRVVQGPVRFTILDASAGAIDGKAVFVSQGNKFQFMMKLPNTDYRGEQFIFDGEKDKVAFSTARQTRSNLGGFLYVQDAAIREGLIGGELSTAWPLLSLDEHKAKLSFEGLKKVEGEELYELRYRPRKSTDLEIRLYFDPQTYRHVKTIYSYTTSERFSGAGTPPQSSAPGDAGGAIGLANSPIGGQTAETALARQQLTRYRLEEKFSDFKTVDGVTLPTHYDIQFSQELTNGKTTLSDWDIKDLNVSNNMSVDPRSFEVK